MSSNAPTPVKSDKTPERVYVEIPKAGPGQGYRAQPNFQRPGLDALGRIITYLLCFSLPVSSGGIIVMILILDHVAREQQLWLWIPLGLFVVGIAVLVAIGVAREALGNAGSGPYTR